MDKNPYQSPQSHLLKKTAAAETSPADKILMLLSSTAIYTRIISLFALCAVGLFLPLFLITLFTRTELIIFTAPLLYFDCRLFLITKHYTKTAYLLEDASAADLDKDKDEDKDTNKNTNFYVAECLNTIGQFFNLMAIFIPLLFIFILIFYYA